MASDETLRERLRSIDGKGYKAYKGIKGEYRFPNYALYIDHVQGDPFAFPSRIRVRADRDLSGFKSDTTSNASRALGICDFLTRQFHRSCISFSRGHRGSGKSGLIMITEPLQEVLQRTAMVINPRFVEARFFMGLPAAGRRISAMDAEAMFFEELPRIVQSSLFLEQVDTPQLYRYIETTEDADSLRNQLDQRGLIGFVADDAHLPRASGIDPRPMDSQSAVGFQSPASLRVEFSLPNRGRITGMGIAKGVTLIVGGGYHGKSTLLEALERGIYNHVPGDGREFVVAHPDTVKIRAANARSIVKTDISPFIRNLPFQKDTAAFSTDNASGSTSQAANIIEAVEVGARVLLLDEDTSATNFMIRDHRMQQLVSKDKEPITPFVDKVKQLYAEKGVSTVLVMGGSGDYFNVADHVIRMTGYLPVDVTDDAHRIAASDTVDRLPEGGDHFGDVKARIPISGSVDPAGGKGRLKISAPRLREIVFGHTSIDLLDIDQITDIAQTRAIAYGIYHATRFMDGASSLKAVIAAVMDDIEKQGLDVLTPYITGDLAAFRGIELAAAINRMRDVRMEQKAQV
ncbi:MAG: ABC-ATPase domain-containing protein [Desulfobacterales bacterium]